MEQPAAFAEPPTASMEPTKPEALVDEVYRVEPRFRKGDRVEYDVKLTPSEGKVGGPGLIVIMTVSVLEADDESVVLEFRLEPPQQLKSLMPKEALWMFELAPQVRLDLTTFQYGLENGGEARQWTLKYGEAQVAGMERRKMDPELIAKFSRAFEAIANDPHLLMAAVLKTPMLFLSTIGQSGVVGKSVESEVDSPNPFGEGTLRAIRRVKVSRDQTTSGMVAFEIEVEPDMGQLFDGMAEAVDRIDGRPFEKEAKEELASGRASFRVQQELTVDGETGWPETNLSRTIFTYEGKRDVNESGMVRRRRVGDQ